MTLAYLNAHLDLLQSLERANETLDALRSAAVPGAQVLTGMPHATGVSDKVGEFAAEIADLEAQMDYIRAQIAESQKRITDWISTIDDVIVRVMLRLRFIRGFQWKEVAGYLGTYTSESKVKNICYKYIDVE